MSVIIAKNHVVTINYRVTGTDGSVIDDGNQPIAYLHGGYDNIFPKIEAALEGKKTGDKLDIVLEPADAFGEYDADLVIIEPQALFEKGVEVGMQVTGNQDDRLLTVTDIADGKVVLDGNHPLAGTTLLFSLTVTDVRAASGEEISHGHVHQPGHHHH